MNGRMWIDPNGGNNDMWDALLKRGHCKRMVFFRNRGRPKIKPEEYLRYFKDLILSLTSAAAAGEAAFQKESSGKGPPFAVASKKLWLWGVCLVLIPALSVTGPSPVRALVGDGNAAFGLDGSIRTIAVYYQYYDLPEPFDRDETQEALQAILRLTAGGRPNDRLTWEVHLVTTLTYDSAGSETGGGMTSRGQDKVRHRAVEDNWAWLEEDDTAGGLWLDRFNLKIALDRMDITIGRQAVTFGKAYFWNPLDVFLPFDPAQFDRDYKAGVDALRLDVPLGDFSGLTLLAVAGREIRLDGSYRRDRRKMDASWYGSSVLGRYFTNVRGWDLAAQGGRIYGGYQLGGALVGELATIEVRAEAAYFWPDGGLELPWPLQVSLYEEHLTAVLGLGRRFENSLHLEFEFLYNDAGEDDRLEIALLRLERGNAIHMGRFLAGGTASYEFTPLHVGRLAVIHSLSDASTQVQPTLTWSLSDNAELILGASLNFGERPKVDLLRGRVIQSEFGSYPHAFFAEFKWYF